MQTGIGQQMSAKFDFETQITSSKLVNWKTHQSTVQHFSGNAAKLLMQPSKVVQPYRAHSCDMLSILKSLIQTFKIVNIRPNDYLFSKNTTCRARVFNWRGVHSRIAHWALPRPLQQKSCWSKRMNLKMQKRMIYANSQLVKMMKMQPESNLGGKGCRLQKKTH